MALIHQVKSPKIGTELPLAKPVLYTGLNLSTPIISAADGDYLRLLMAAINPHRNYENKAI